MDRATTFDRVRRRHLTEFHTLAYDRRGYASSSGFAFGGDAFADHVADLRGVIDEVVAQLSVPVVLVGHSAGSNIVMAVAAQRHPAVKGLVVFEPPMPWTDWWPGQAGGQVVSAANPQGLPQSEKAGGQVVSAANPQGLPQSEKAGGSTLAVYEAEGPAAAAESFMRRVVGDRMWEMLPPETKAARRSEGEGLIADLMTLRGRPVQFDHRLIQVPTAVGFGGKSLDHQRRSSIETATLIAGSDLIELVGHGHGAHGTDPEGFSGLIHRIIKKTR
jgi:pimeloyl-ACP methyl ester carboxylesterase